MPGRSWSSNRSRLSAPWFISASAAHPRFLRKLTPVRLAHDRPSLRRGAFVECGELLEPVPHVAEILLADAEFAGAWIERQDAPPHGGFVQPRESRGDVHHLLWPRQAGHDAAAALEVLAAEDAAVEG